LDKTNITEEMIGEYSGDTKNIRPITVATYQVLTVRRDPSKPRKKKKGKETDEPAGDLDSAMDDWEVAEEKKKKPGLGEEDGYYNLDLFNRQNWGMIIYDEVHLLPAPVFRITAEIQARRRLGLTATLVREDGREDDVFSLIGPKKADVPWKVLEKQGWIATAICTEIRIALQENARLDYAIADPREKFRLASTNSRKEDVIAYLLEKHKDDNVLIIGQYLDQLDHINARFVAPIITGKTPQREREKIYQQFRVGEIKLLIVSKVANFSIDLPDANVAIQVSGTFGSRQEEAQRLGRVLRPKSDGSVAHFYSIVTRETRDQEFATHRQLFLTEQGYRYEIVDAEKLME